jgi:signal transduction histidine kinase/outer membrane murein-binding lipoprotein Lpp
MAGNFGSTPSGADGVAALGLTVASAPPGELTAGPPPVDHPLLKQAPGRMLRNWRVRSRLVLLIAIPTATAVALGGVSIVGSWRSAVANQRTETLASLSTKVTRLANQIEAERDAIVWYIAAGDNGRAFTFLKPPGKAASSAVAATYADEQTASASQLQIVHQQFTFTGPWTRAVDDGVSQITSGYPAAVQAAAAAVKSKLGTLDGLRDLSLHSLIAASTVIQDYGDLVSTLLSFDDQLALSSNDATLTSTARALGAISRSEYEDSVQRAVVMYALTSGSLNANLLQLYNASLANGAADFVDFKDFATTAQQSAYGQALAQSLSDRVSKDELTVGQDSSDINAAGIAALDWYGDMSDEIRKVHNFEESLASSAVDRSQALRQGAIVAAIAVGTLILLVLVLSLLFTVFVGRSMVRPLRRLRAGALEVAGIKLPETVRRMNETDGETVPVEVEPIDVESTDEIGEVARAFDQVHREALRLAATEAALRGNVNAMFVNLSRRSQSLVERQIRLIDELEQGEQDSDRLSSLFQMDHLATRMRRNSENLLVLAGHESSRRWNQPVPLVDVLRAAISEIEQYERVILNVQPGIAVRGPAVNDVVHLIAELAENATSFSSADTPVGVSGHLLGSGGVLLDITDEGVGMASEEMAHANWRLDNPPVVDVAVSRRMGLFVVARLAARHGIRVRLRPASGNGLTALVWLPDEVIVHDGASGAGDAGRFGERSARAAIEQTGGFASTGVGDWAASRQPSAQDEVAAARARFSPLGPESNGFGGADYAQPDGSVPGLNGPGGGRDRELAAGGRFGDAPFGDRANGGQPGDSVPARPAAFDGAGSDRLVTDSGPIDLGPHRVPGAGPHPGRFVATSTGPMPAVESGSRSGVEQPEWFANMGGRPDIDDTGTMPAAVGEQGPPALSTPGDTSWPAEPAADSSVPGWQSPSPSWSQGPSTGERPWSADQTDAQPVFGAPVARSAPFSSTFRTQDSQFGTAAGGVIVPPPASLGEENRLPIFEAVESDWFRRGRPTVEWPGGGSSGGSSQEERVTAPARGWSSPADDGWRAAEIAVAPASGGTTVAGLPRRVPQANLIPGTAAAAATTTTEAAPAPVPARSAAATRERFASLQRGIREGRAATGIDGSAGTGEVPGDG